MNPRKTKVLDSRFSGPLRHYHRTNTKAEKSWEEWIEGKPPSQKTGTRWWIVVLAIFGLIALAAIAIGLFIEMR
jgi:hypothetical protein